MSRPPKKKPAGGRVTPKGTRPGTGGGTRRTVSTDLDEGTPAASSRYTPPVPQSEKVSPPWVAPLMFALLGLGILIIVLNYMGLLPGGTDNWYLLAGLGVILGGIITATRLH